MIKFIDTKTWKYYKPTKEIIKQITAMAKFERKHNTFFEEKDIKCDYLHCNAGMGIAGMGKCFNKGNGKPNCPKFIDEEMWLKEKGLL